MDFDCEDFGMDSSRAGSEDPGSDPDETFLREMAGLTQKFSVAKLDSARIYGLIEKQVSKSPKIVTPIYLGEAAP